jgi:hypothetical protein
MFQSFNIAFSVSISRSYRHLKKETTVKLTDVPVFLAFVYLTIRSKNQENAMERTLQQYKNRKRCNFVAPLCRDILTQV